MDNASGKSRIRVDHPTRKYTFTDDLCKFLGQVVKRIFGRVGQVWREAPTLLLLAQLPETTVDLVEKALGLTKLGESPMLLALAILPYFWIASATSLYLTAFVVFSLDRKEIPTARGALDALGSRLPQIVSSSLLAGVVVLVGIPLVFPGLYFMCCYLFVPVCIAADPLRVPSSALLSRSKKIARTRLSLVVPLGAGLLGVGLALFFVEEALQGAGVVDGLALLCKMMIAVPLGACVYAAVSEFYLILTGAPGRQREILDETPRRSA